MSDQPPEADASTAIAERETTLEALTRRPVIDQLDDRALELLRDKAPNLNHGELARALELAVAYDLDPWANEIWFAKGRGQGDGGGRLLIMVGRDGLRKIAQRNGLAVDGDVVRAEDTFLVRRGPDRRREVVHEYGGDAEARGALVGAWAECWDRTSGEQRGFFFAPVDEYRPASPDARSVWAKQVSVMTLAAAERQAVRQATPLGGLLVEGEDELVRERLGAPAPDVDPFEGLPLADEVRGVVELAGRLGHVGLASVATAQMTLRGRGEEDVARWVRDAREELERKAEPGGGEVQDAEVVDGEPDDGRPAGPRQADEAADNAYPYPVPVRKPSPAAQGMLDRANGLLDEAAAARDEGDEDRAAELEAEAEALRDAAGVEDDPTQPSLGVE